MYRNFLFFLPMARMNWPIQTAEAPSPAPRPAKQAPQKVERQRLYKADPLKRTPQRRLHTAVALSPARPSPLTTEHPRAQAPGPVSVAAPHPPHPCLHPPQTSPWNLWARLRRKRKAQTGSTRTWTGTAASRRAVRTSRRCREDSRVREDTSVRTLSPHLLMVSTAVS